MIRLYNQSGEQLARTSQASIKRSLAICVDITSGSEEDYSMVWGRGCYLCKDLVKGSKPLFTVLVPDEPDQEFPGDRDGAISYFLERINEIDTDETVED